MQKPTEKPLKEHYGLILNKEGSIVRTRDGRSSLINHRQLKPMSLGLVTAIVRFVHMMFIHCTSPTSVVFACA